MEFTLTVPMYVSLTEADRIAADVHCVRLVQGIGSLFIVGENLDDVTEYGNYISEKLGV